MRVVLDTNVLISGIFFGGPPSLILEQWAEGRFELVVSPAIIAEYQAVCERLAEKRPGIEYRAPLFAIIGHATLLPDGEFAGAISADPDDDKFMIVANDATASVVSGDRHLLDVDGWEGVAVITPRVLLDRLGTWWYR